MFYVYAFVARESRITIEKVGEPFVEALEADRAALHHALANNQPTIISQLSNVQEIPGANIVVKF